MAKGKRLQKDGNTFAGVIRRVLKSRRITQAEAAAHLDLAAGTFRVRLARNSFENNDIEQLKAYLDLEEETLGGIDFGHRFTKNAAIFTAPKTLAAALRIADRKRKSLDVHLDRFADELIPLTGAMGSTDICVIVSATVTPLEMENGAPAKLIRPFVRAVLNGGRFIYLRPTDQFIKANYINDLHYDRLVRAEDARREVKRFKEKLAELLRHYKEEDWGRESPTQEEALQRVEDQVMSFEAESSPFFAPGFSFSLFHTRDEGGSVIRRTTIRVPGSGRALLQEREYEHFPWRLNKWIVHVLKSQLSNAEESGRDALELIIEELSDGGMAE